MFYRTQPPPPQVRHHCRYLRCGAKLNVPTDNRHDAFCSKGCWKQFYDRHCIVCEAVIPPPKTKPRAVCRRSHCKHEVQRHPERYSGVRYPSARLGQISSRSAHFTGLKTSLKSGRGSRVIAGPAVHPVNLQTSELPTSKANAAFRECWQAEARKALIQRDTPPVNIVGGFKFPGAPKIGLTPTRTPPRVPATDPSIGDDLDIPEFLKRVERSEAGGQP
jgi:hypothetical protein